MAQARLNASLVAETNPQVSKQIQNAAMKSAHPELRVGFVPLTDCAPIVMARELGLFEKYRLNVVLSREVAFRPRVRRVLQQHMRWNPSCGELECGGCSHYLIGPNVGSTGGSSSERRYSVDRVGAGWIESSEQRAYSTREACMRADALRRGPLFSDCDDP